MSEQDDIGGGIYRQEAAELVQSIEAGLLALEQSPDDLDRINAVFRDLHTVKGSGAMFGFTELAMFVHDFETAFDKLRRGEASVTSALIAIALQACDQILALLDNPAAAADQSRLLLGQLRDCLEGKAVSPGATSDPAPDMAVEPPWSEADVEDDDSAPEVHEAPMTGEDEGLRVVFRLDPGALALGHDPELMLDELRALGPCRVRALVDAVPALDQLDPTLCLFGWEVEISGPVSPSDVETVFLFTRDSMQLEITPLASRLAADDVAPSDLAPVVQPIAPEPVADPRPAPASAKAAAPAAVTGDTMRVATRRLDELMDRVGELVIAEARLRSLAHHSADAALLSVAEEIQRLSDRLRDSTMSLRMVPMSSILGRFTRLIRDLSASLGKPMTFVTQGEDTALDKTVIEMLADPLVHILRNSADHGLERPEDRVAAGKPATGTIELSANYSGAEVVISIRDDGRGLDAARIRARAVERGLISATADLPESELFRLIFEPGFSTAAAVTELSGRGVGMDVVKRTISSLRGSIDLSSEPGHGTTVCLRLPLTLAIIDGLLVDVGGEHYTIPLAAVEECVELPAELAAEHGGSSFMNIRGNLVPFLRLRSLLGVSEPPPDYQKVVVVTSAGARVGLAVDRIVANNQTVIKQLSRLHVGVKGFSGATILSDGRVALIMDVQQLVGLGKRMEEALRQGWAA